MANGNHNEPVMPEGGWGEITSLPKPAAPVRRGTHRRRARTVGMHMSQFWAASSEDRQMMYEISKAGRRK